MGGFGFLFNRNKIDNKKNLFKNNKSLVFFRNKKLKIGLALGGGGTRGFAHIGAIKAFEEHGLKFDCVAGTSVGSLVGAFYADGKTYKEMYDVAKQIKAKDIRTSKFIFVPSNSDGLEKIVGDSISAKNIEDLKIPYCAVAVDIKSTNECWLTKGELSKAVAGSCAVPGIFNPVEFDDLLLSDGGLQNTIPANVLRDMNCDYVVSIDVNPSRGYGTNSAKVFDVLACSIRILMKSNAIKGYLYSDCILKPDTKRFKSTKTDDFEDMIDEGYRAAIDAMPEILKIFSGLTKRKKLPTEVESTKIIKR